jgi:hypothetical protein
MNHISITGPNKYAQESGENVTDFKYEIIQGLIKYSFKEDGQIIEGVCSNFMLSTEED